MIQILLLAALALPGAAAAPPEAAREPRAASNYEEGKRLADRGLLDEALPLLERAVRQNPRHEQAHLRLGSLYAEIGRVSSAVDSFERALKANPGSAAARLELSRLHEARGEYELALADFSEFARLRPKDPGRALRLARLHLAASLENYLEALRQSSGDAAKSLRERIDGMLAADEANPMFAYFRGRLMLDDGNAPEAIENLERAARLSPDFRVASALRLAPLYAARDLPERAARQYATLAEFDVEDLAAAREAARISFQTGDYGSAEKFFRRVWSATPSVMLARELGQVLLATKRYEETSELYRKVAAKDQPELLWSLAQTCKRDGQYALALREFESLLDRYPDRAALEREIHDVTQLRLKDATPAAGEVAKGGDGLGSEAIPEALLVLADGEYAMLVDKSTQTLLLYQGQGGEARHVKTYACSTGENAGEKLEKGDKKTPEGIYQFTEVKTSAELPRIYGKLAFPMDYPNFFDRRQGKNGSGIWLHSTDEPIRALLPQKTRGCIVVNDPVIEELAGFIRLFDTPIVVARELKVGGGEARGEARREIERLLEQWRESWQSKDLERYLALYSDDFRHEAMDLAAWRRFKQGIFERSGRITVRVSPRHVLRHEDYAVATFRQDYTADTHADTGIKRLFLVREDGLWRIAGEEWRAL